MRKLILFLLLFFVLFGCTVGPKYQRPAAEMPASWNLEEKEAREVTNTRWWEQFDDPRLDDLIQTALRKNKDIKIAASRVEEFVGRYGTTRADLFPRLSTSAGAARTRAVEKGPSPAENPSDSFQVFFNANWELDLWGKLRRASEASRADLLSTEESRTAIILTIVTNVASGYVNLRNLDRQLDIAKRTVKSREETYNLFQIRLQGGVISQLELNQVKSEYEQALSTVPSLEKLIVQQENALRVLLGENPGFVSRGKSIDDLRLPSVPAGLPSDLLVNRPDIRQAEQNLIAANARIGVARAQYFPTISLTGLFGSVSSDLSNLFTHPTKTWNWAVPVAAPIFTGGAIRGQVKSAEAVQQQALLRYQQSIQAAFREVEDALVDQKKSREQLEIQTQRVETLRNYARIARLGFDYGHTSYLEVLDAERSLFNAELSQAGTKGALFQALVNLYKAIGGGWVIEAARMTEALDSTHPKSTKEK